MGFFNDLTPKRPATATTPVTDFLSDNNDASVPANGVSAVATPVATPSPEVQQTNTPPSETDTTSPTSTIEVPSPVEKVSFTQQPTEDVTKITPNQGIQIDWSKPYAQIEQDPILRQMKPYDILKDFEKNGNGDYASFMPWFSKLGDVDRTVAANEALQKKAERQAKWERWGNLFQHIGNFFGTAIGAPEQKVESAQELTERQRKIREATDALRAKGYDQMMTNIWKERQAKQAQMQAEAEAKAKEAQAAYYGSQKNQVDALTNPKVKVQEALERQHTTAADLNDSKKKTEDALRDKKGKLLTAQANNANSSAADHAAGVAVKGAQVRHINAQTEGQNQTNAANKEADDFNTQYVNDPVFKKHVNEWASHNGMAIGGSDGTGGTWANKYNRQQASAYAKAKMKRDRTPPSRRPGANGGSKVPPSRRKGTNSKVPPSRR